jgi:hypothetical protein
MDVEATVVVVIIGNSSLVEILKDDSNEVNVVAELNIRVEVVSAIDVKNTTRDEDKPFANELASVSHKLMSHSFKIGCEDPTMHKLFSQITN